MMWPTRVGPLLALKEKLTIPFVTLVTVSHGTSVAGKNGKFRFCVAGTTGGKESEPAAMFSDLPAISMKAYGSFTIRSWLAPTAIYRFRKASIARACGGSVVA